MFLVPPVEEEYFIVLRRKQKLFFFNVTVIVVNVMSIKSLPVGFWTKLLGGRRKH